MRGFRPHRAPTLITIPIVFLCAALGVWQLQRLEWKRGLIAERAAALTHAPVALPRILGEARKLALHPVVAEGAFLNDKEIMLNAIGPKGAAGFDVLTPLREADGRILFVNRGFVPTALKDPAKRDAGELSGKVHIVGLLRLPPPQKPNWFVPDNRSAQGDWFWIDLAAMAAADRLATVAPFYIDADATPNPGGWPKGGLTLPALPNHHLQYAITWFSLAVAAFVIYVLSQRSGGDNRDDERIPRT
ncbi:MAG TPA: SURF1 family protein [Stellaceae bacterium]|nr:SURF1 family protein [Stellaceae bacterium]